MKKLFKVIPLTITLSLLIIALLLNITAKQVTDEITGEIWKAIIPQSLIEQKDKTSSWFQDIMNNENVKGFIDKYIDSEEVNKVKDKINETKEKAEQEVEKYVDEFIKEQEEKLSPEQRFALNTYRFITNAKLKGILIIAIIINILLIAFTEWSLFKWIKSASWAMAISGVAVLLFTEWLKSSIESLIHITVTLKMLTLPSVGLLLGGVIIRFIYFVIATIIKANKDKKEEKDEVS